MRHAALLNVQPAEEAQYAVPQALRNVPAPWIAIAALVAAGAAIRLWGIGDRDLWLDEALSVFYAHLSWADVVELRRGGTNPPLYHFLLSLWVGLFGDTAVSVRMLSWACGVVSVWAIYRLALRLAGRRTAIAAAILLCVSHMAVVYSQEARFYAMVELVSILATWALHAWVTAPSSRSALAYLAVMSVFVWLHTFAWFVLAAHATWIAWIAVRSRDVRERRRLLRDSAIGLCVVAAVFAPWLPILMQQLQKASAGYWIGRPTAATLAACLYEHVAPVSRLRYAVAGLAVVIGVVALWRRSTRRSTRTPAALCAPPRGQRPPYALFISWLIIPIGVPLLWSVVATPIFQVKYTIVAQPAALILLAHAATRATVPLMAIIAVLSIWRPVSPDYLRVVEHWRQAAEIIEQSSQPSAPIYVHHDYCTFALAYYLADPQRIVPVHAPGAGPGWFDPYYPNAPIPVEELPGRLRTEAGECWVVLARVRGQDSSVRSTRIYDELDRARQITRHWPLRGVDVLLLGEMQGRNPGRTDQPGARTNLDADAKGDPT